LGYYLNTNVKGLSNGDELPITVIGGCLVGKFNTDPDCFAWSFMLNSNGGSIGVFAATEGLYSADGTSTIKSSGGLIEISMFKSYKELGAITFGEMWAWGLENYITTRNMKLKNTYKYDYVTVEEWQPFGDPTLQIAEPSEPPEKPQTPSGPASGLIGEPATYTTRTTDPEEDEVYYLFNWGDNTDSGWLGPYESGAFAEGIKTWNREGTFSVKVIARDVHGKLSEWSDELIVTMPRNRDLSRGQGTFYAEMGRRENGEPEVYLNGNYNSRGRYITVKGTATKDENQVNFRGIFFRNFFILQSFVGDRKGIIFGRCTIEDQTFTGQWRSRFPRINGWINGAFTPQ
jgi:hypothetical protein